MNFRTMVIAAAFLTIMATSVQVALGQTTLRVNEDADTKTAVRPLGQPRLLDNSAADTKTAVRPFSTYIASDSELMSLGQAWQVTECCGWTGTWTRRSGTNVFDARWRHTNGTTAQDVITLTSWNKTTNQVVLKRQGLNGTYQGRLDPSGRTITQGTASWYPAGQAWSARY